jgi:probable F420-dependent oxidoreductase
VKGIDMDAPRIRPLKVGLILQIHENIRTRNTPGWPELCAIAQRAEAVGFDSIWMPDHLLFRFAPDDMWDIWEGWSMLSAVAATTSRAEIGTLVTCTGFRNPALLAKMASTVDEISAGRLVLGLGAGWHEPEYEAFGLPFDHRASRFEEALTIIATLLREGHIDFDGTYYQARDCELRPRGPRPGGIPILVGAGGERMMRLTARLADAWTGDFGPAGTLDGYPATLALVDAACAAEGRDPATLARHATIEMDLPGAGSSPWPMDSILTGTPEEQAEILRGFAAHGVSHIHVRVEPNTLAGLDDFAGVLELLDAG